MKRGVGESAYRQQHGLLTSVPALRQGHRDLRGARVTFKNIYIYKFYHGIGAFLGRRSWYGPSCLSRRLVSDIPATGVQSFTSTSALPLYF